MRFHRHHYAEWAHVNPMCGTKTAHRAQDDLASVTKGIASEPRGLRACLQGGAVAPRWGSKSYLFRAPGADRLVRKDSCSGHSVALLPQKTYVSPPKKCMYRCKKRGRHDATPVFTNKNKHKVVCMAASHLAVRRIGGRRGVTLRAGLVTRE